MLATTHFQTAQQLTLDSAHTVAAQLCVELLAASKAQHSKARYQAATGLLKPSLSQALQLQSQLIVGSHARCTSSSAPAYVACIQERQRASARGRAPWRCARR